MLYLLFAAPLIDPEAQSVDPYPPSSPHHLVPFVRLAQRLQCIVNC